MVVDREFYTVVVGIAVIVVVVAVVLCVFPLSLLSICGLQAVKKTHTHRTLLRPVSC